MLFVNLISAFSLFILLFSLEKVASQEQQVVLEPSSIQSGNGVDSETDIDTDIPNYTKEDLLEISVSEGRNRLTEFCTWNPRNITWFTPSLEKLRIRFLVTKNSHAGLSLALLDQITRSAYFRPLQNVTIFLTGWKGIPSSSEDLSYQLSRVFDCRQTHNFLILDVGAEVNDLLKWSTYDYESVGQFLAHNLSSFIANMGPERIHLIGHGIGAHVAGTIGKRFYMETGKLLSRITGLDPANVCLLQRGQFYGLQKGDAEFVDVIHSSSYALGSPCLHGDVDIFVQSFTRNQLGCENIICEHYRAVEYFLETVLPNGGNEFYACRSFSIQDVRRNVCVGPKILFGFEMSRNVKGNYYYLDYELPFFGVDASRCNVPSIK